MSYIGSAGVTFST